MKQLNAYSDQLTSYGRYFSEIAGTARGSAEAKQAENMINALYERIQDAVSLNGYSAVLMPTPATSDVAADFVPSPTCSGSSQLVEISCIGTRSPPSPRVSIAIKYQRVFRSAQPPMTTQPRCELLRPWPRRLPHSSLEDGSLNS